MEYTKINTLFNRNEKFIVDTEQFRSPVVATINLWEVTEKVDGTNIRVMLDESGAVNFGGRTERANIPADLVRYLLATFTPEKMQVAFAVEGKPLPNVVLYGEGYGAGIQKVGGLYRADKSFRLFDILVGGRWWLNWTNTCDVAQKLGIKTVPFLGRWTLDEIVTRTRAGIASVTAQEDSGQTAIAEGIVARTLEPLFDAHGKRLIIKLKTKDFGK